MKQDSPPNNPSTAQDLPDYAEPSDTKPAPALLSWLGNPKKRRLLLWASLALLILPTVPFAYRAVKTWRANSLLEKSSLAFAVGDVAKGLGLLKQAIALTPGNLSVQHAVELYDARAGDVSSREKLIGRMRKGESDLTELIGLAEIEAGAGNVDSVIEVLKLVPRGIPSHLQLRRILIETAILSKRGEFAKAAAYCLESASGLSKEDSLRLRTQGAIYLLALKEHSQTRAAIDVLKEIVKTRGKASLNAWRILSKLALSPPAGSTGVISPEEISWLIQQNASLPGVTPTDKLLNADLQIKADPSTLERVVGKERSARLLSPRLEMLEFARWLNAHGQYKEVVEFAGPEKPRNDTDWLLIVLDALSAQGSWEQVTTLMNSPAGAGIPDAVRHLFLARVAMIGGQKDRAEDEWHSVDGALHLEKPETLAYVAGYEEQIGAYDRASHAYREMANREQTRVPGLVGLIRSQPRNASASVLIPIYAELINASPDLTDARGDLAYLRLLANQDLEDSAKTAKDLLDLQPDNLSRISVAALAKLRLGDVNGALALYSGKTIDWTVVPDQWRLIRLAVLKAHGDTDSAEFHEGSLNQSMLRPEEKALLDSKPSLKEGKKRKQ